MANLYQLTLLGMNRSMHHTLYINKSISVPHVTFLILLLVATLFFAVDPPLPHDIGRYATLYSSIGPVGISVLSWFVVSALMIVSANSIADRYSDGIAAAITDDGISVRLFFLVRPPPVERN